MSASRRRALWLAWLFFLLPLTLGVVSTLWSLGRRAPPPAPAPPPLSVRTLLGGADSGGFDRAEAPHAFSFPDDHGPHPGFRSEWWYLSGHLRSGRRHFGYQLTIFRQALAPKTPSRSSAWATRQVYMGHLTVTDVKEGRFVAFEKLAREGLALAGAQSHPFAVWVEGWRLDGPSQGGLFPLRIEASARDLRGRDPIPSVTLALTLSAGRGPLLQGEQGLSVKGPEPGNASHYYSMTRLPTGGRLVLDGEPFEVEGESWLDREWSTSALGPTIAGWDWLGLHLSDGRDLMLYRLRRRDGTAAPESRATLMAADGSRRVFRAEEIRLSTTEWWISPHTGIRYPAGLALELPRAALMLSVSPWVPDQEVRLSVRYWEGLVRAHGRSAEGPLDGTGYLELTGYEAATARPGHASE